MSLAEKGEWMYLAEGMILQKRHTVSQPQISTEVPQTCADWRPKQLDLIPSDLQHTGWFILWTSIVRAVLPIVRAVLPKAGACHMVFST